ncbi:MAG: hypothetical protein ACI8TP_003221 [Acidimicrobiales bacterium]|jgi:hypothetical protein
MVSSVQRANNDVAQLLKRWRPRHALRSRIDATRKTHRRRRISEWVDAVDEHTRRPSEPERFGRLRRVHHLATDMQSVELCGEHLEMPIDLDPIRALFEIEQRDLHSPKPTPSALKPSTDTAHVRDPLAMPLMAWPQPQPTSATVIPSSSRSIAPGTKGRVTSRLGVLSHSVPTSREDHAND